MNRFNRDHILGLIRESKSQVKRGNLLDSLRILESLPSDIFTPSNDIGWRVVGQMVTYCNKLTSSVSDKSYYLNKAEMLLINWICTCHQQQKPVKEKLVKLLLLTINSWSSYHKSQGNPKLALSYLTKHLKFIEEFEVKKPITFRQIASTMYNASSLYLDLRQYSQAHSFATAALNFLQKEKVLSGGSNGLENLPLFISCHYNIGLALQASGNHSESNEAFNIAAKASKNLPSGHTLSLLVNGYTERNKTPGFIYQRNQTKSPIVPVLDLQNLKQIQRTHKEQEERSKPKIPSIYKLEREPNIVLSGNTQLVQKDKEEKENISRLRLRKHHKKSSDSNRNAQYFQNKIEQIKKMEESRPRAIDLPINYTRNNTRQKVFSHEKSQFDFSSFASSPRTDIDFSSFHSVNDTFEHMLHELKYEMPSMSASRYMKNSKLNKTSETKNRSTKTMLKSYHGISKLLNKHK